MKRRRSALSVLVCLGFLARPAAAVLFNHSTLDSILQRYVDEEGLVNYTSIRENSLSGLDSYFERLADADMAGWPYEERLAFWVNAYNARVIYLVAQKPKLNKISEDFEMFNRPFKVAGVMLSANDIEHRILRGTINPDNQKGPIAELTLAKLDPRIHFALVCGTIDCPRLRTFAYTAENVEDTFYGNAKRFANSPKYVDIVDGKLKLSSILKWNAKDFAAQGGVAAYLREQISPEKRSDAENVTALLIADFKKAQYSFDWTVNDQQKNAPKTRLKTVPLHAPPDASSTSDSLLGKPE